MRFRSALLVIGCLLLSPANAAAAVQREFLRLEIQSVTIDDGLQADLSAYSIDGPVVLESWPVNAGSEDVDIWMASDPTPCTGWDWMPCGEISFCEVYERVLPDGGAP